MAEKQLVVFGLGKELYGVDILVVEGIIKMQEITKVPHAPKFVEGVTNLRGQVMPVIDLRKRFGISELNETDETRIITVEVGGVQAGMIVDHVSEVLTINEDNIEGTSSIVTTTSSEFVKGIAKVDDKLVILVELSKVLSTDEADELELVAEIA